MIHFFAGQIICVSKGCHGRKKSRNCKLKRVSDGYVLMQQPPGNHLILIWTDFNKKSSFYLLSSLHCWRTLHLRHNGHDSVSNHQPHHCLINRLFGCRSKKTSKLRVTGLCAGNSPGTAEFLAQMASNAANVSIWWRHHEFSSCPVE